LLADGRRFVAVSDRGFWFAGTLWLGADGALRGIGGLEMSVLLRPDGRSARGQSGMSDAEAVERLDDGSLVVSFEQQHRIWRYADTGAAAEVFLEPPEFRDLPGNGGIEAMTPLAGGGLLLLAEEARDAQGGLKGWLWRGGRLRPLHYVSTDSYAPTDMARLGNGDVLVLERRFSPLLGFGARIGRLAAATIAPGARLVPEEVARLEWPKWVENFEAIATAPAPGGGDYVYLVSDDNFRALQDTLLLQFLLRP
jgi:hypothetical protein